MGQNYSNSSDSSNNYLEPIKLKNTVDPDQRSEWKLPPSKFEETYQYIHQELTPQRETLLDRNGIKSIYNNHQNNKFEYILEIDDQILQMPYRKVLIWENSTDILNDSNNDSNSNSVNDNNKCQIEEENFHKVESTLSNLFQEEMNIISNSSEQSKEDYDHICCVCLDEDQSNNLIKIVCNHPLCKICYESIMTNFNNLCPICRQPIIFESDVNSLKKNFLGILLKMTNNSQEIMKEKTDIFPAKSKKQDSFQLYHFPIPINSPYPAGKKIKESSYISNQFMEIIQNHHVLDMLQAEDYQNLFGSKIILLVLGEITNRYVFDTFGYINILVYFFPEYKEIPIGKITGTRLENTNNIINFLIEMKKEGYQVWFNSPKEEEWMQYMALPSELYI